MLSAQDVSSNIAAPASGLAASWGSTSNNTSATTPSDDTFSNWLDQAVEQNSAPTPDKPSVLSAGETDAAVDSIKGNGATAPLTAETSPTRSAAASAVNVTADQPSAATQDKAGSAPQASAAPPIAVASPPATAAEPAIANATAAAAAGATMANKPDSRTRAANDLTVNTPTPNRRTADTPTVDASRTAPTTNAPAPLELLPSTPQTDTTGMSAGSLLTMLVAPVTPPVSRLVSTANFTAGSVNDIARAGVVARAYAAVAKRATAAAPANSSSTTDTTAIGGVAAVAPSAPAVAPANDVVAAASGSDASTAVTAPPTDALPTVALGAIVAQTTSNTTSQPVLQAMAQTQPFSGSDQAVTQVAASNSVAPTHADQPATSPSVVPPSPSGDPASVVAASFGTAPLPVAAPLATPPMQAVAVGTDSGSAGAGAATILVARGSNASDASATFTARTIPVPSLATAQGAASATASSTIVVPAIANNLTTNQSAPNTSGATTTATEVAAPSVVMTTVMDATVTEATGPLPATPAMPVPVTPRSSADSGAAAPPKPAVTTDSTASPVTALASATNLAAAASVAAYGATAVAGAPRQAPVEQTDTPSPTPSSKPSPAALPPVTVESATAAPPPNNDTAAVGDTPQTTNHLPTPSDTQTDTSAGVSPAISTASAIRQNAASAAPAGPPVVTGLPTPSAVPERVTSSSSDQASNTQSGTSPIGDAANALERKAREVASAGPTPAHTGAVGPRLGATPATIATNPSPPLHPAAAPVPSNAGQSVAQNAAPVINDLTIPNNAPAATTLPSPGTSTSPEPNQSAAATNTLDSQSAPAPAAQLASAIVAFTANGSTNVVTVQLQPEELGRVQISVSSDASGRSTVVVSAERPDTLNLLQRDQPALSQALDQAGIPSAGRSVTFQLSNTASTANGGAANAANADAGHGAATATSFSAGQTSTDPSAANPGGNAPGPSTVSTANPGSMSATADNALAAANGAGGGSGFHTSQQGNPTHLTTAQNGANSGTNGGSSGGNGGARGGGQAPPSTLEDTNDVSAATMDQLLPPWLSSGLNILA